MLNDIDKVNHNRALLKNYLPVRHTLFCLFNILLNFSSDSNGILVLVFWLDSREALASESG